MKVVWCLVETKVRREKMMVWLGVCSKGLASLVISHEETVNHSCHIKNVLPVAVKYGNEVCGSK